MQPDVTPFERLWQAAQANLNAHGGFLSYFPAESVRGEFRRGKLPRIWLYRPLETMPEVWTDPDKVTDPDLDASILAHEFGHFLTWTQGLRPKGFVSASVRDKHLDSRLTRAWSLREADLLKILAEEEQAWALGKALLEEVGFQNWPVFEARQKLSLGYHKRQNSRYRSTLTSGWVYSGTKLAGKRTGRC